MHIYIYICIHICLYNLEIRVFDKNISSNLKIYLPNMCTRRYCIVLTVSTYVYQIGCFYMSLSVYPMYHTYVSHAMYLLQGSKDACGAFICMSRFAKEPVIIGPY